MSNDQKTELLFKQFNNVVNARQEADFSTTSQNKFPFRNYVNNKEIFSNDIPDELSNITFTNSQGVISYGCQALDFSFANATPPVAANTIYKIPNTDLTFFYRVDLQQAIPQTNRTWYLPDISNSNFSSLNDTIPYNYDPSFNSYSPLLYGQGSNIPQPLFSTNGGNLKWLIDYKSGFVQFYGDDDNVINDWLSLNGPPRISLIKYTGPKGAAGGSGGGGSGDASFNNVDISGDLNVANLTVTESASLPKDTLIQPIFYKLAGSHISNHPFFDKEYAQTQSYNAICVDPSINVVTTTDWITIARVAENISSNQDGRADALFKISHPQSGRHETITFFASFKYAQGLSINVIQHDWYSGPSFDALRIKYEGNFDGAVLQLRFTNNGLNNSGGTRNPLQIYIKDDHDYPGWEQFTDVSGTPIILDGREVFYAIPNNNPTRIDNSSTLLTQEFLLDNLGWNPNSGNANQITTNPARFTNQVDVGGNITTDSSITANVNITANNNIEGLAGIFDDLTVNNDADVDRYLTVNKDGFIQRLEATNFDGPGTMVFPGPLWPGGPTPSPYLSRPYLAEILAQIPPNIGPFSGIKNIIGHATFEIIASSSNPANKNSSRNQVIIGTVLVTASCKDGTNNYRDITGSINIIQSSWCGSTTPLINRVFLDGIAQASSNSSNITCRFYIDSSAVIPYLTFKLKNNNKNDNSIVQITGSPLPVPSNQGTFHTHWNINSIPLKTNGLINTSATNATFINNSITIPSDKKSFTSLGAEQVDIPNFLSRKIEIGDSNSNISFKASSFTLSGVSEDDWFTIAQIGPSNVSGSAQIRGLAIIEISNRTSSRHQCVRMFVSQLFSRGGSIDAYNIGYNSTNSVQYKAVRIVSDSTYDGALLQIKGGASIVDASGNAINPHYINLMSSTNNPGWQLIPDGSVVVPDNSPTKYAGNNIGAPYGEPNGGWTEISLLGPIGYTTTASTNPRAWTGKVTTLPTTFQGARLQVIDESISIKDVSLNNNITIELDASANGKISCNNNINLEASGNIILDTSGDVVAGSSGVPASTKAIIGVAANNIYFQANNQDDISGNSSIHFKQYGVNQFNFIKFTINDAAQGMNGNDYDLKWNVTGLGVDTKDIIEVGSLYGDNNRTIPMLLQADNKQTFQGGRLYLQSQPIYCRSAFSFMDLGATKVNDYLADVSGTNNAKDGTMLYDKDNHFLSARRNSEVWGMTSPFKDTYILSLAAKNHRTSNTFKRLAASGSSPLGTKGKDITHGHVGGEGYDLWNQTPQVSGTSSRRLYCSKIVAQNDLYIKKINMRGYGHRLKYFNTTTVDINVDFETWLVYGTSPGQGFRDSYTFETGGTSIGSDLCPEPVKNKNIASSQALLLQSFTKTTRDFANPSPQYLDKPFTNGNSVINIDVVQKNGGVPFKVPSGNRYGIVLLERRNTNITSGNIIFDEYTNSTGTSAISADSMNQCTPIKFEIYGEINYLS